MSLVCSIAEVGDVVPVGYVGFRDQERSRRRLIQHRPEDLDNPVGLGQVQAAGAQLLPEKAHRVQAEVARPLFNVKEEELHHLQQHLGVFVVEVDLVCAEGGPEMLFPLAGDKRREQGQRPGPDDLGEVCPWIAGDEEILEGGIPRQVFLKPLALGGDVVDHRIEHQIEILGQVGDVRPAPQLITDLPVVDDRKTIVGGIGVKGQNVDGGNKSGQKGAGKARQGPQGR